MIHFAQVIINKVANGFVVTIPVLIAQQDQMAMQAKAMREGMKEPTEIELLQGKESGESNIPEIPYVFRLQEQKNVFVFTEYSQLLDFLTEKVE